MNELKLTLHNFQSISDGELTFKTGIKFIIGQSNSGKSATFRALKACLANPTGTQRFIKRGTNKATVRLQYNGHDILWEKTLKENNYYINEKAYLKTGKSNAFKIIMDETGFVQDDSGVIMNIEEELQLPFPFGCTSSELFKLFENVFCISDSAVILKSAKDYEKGIDTEITSLNLEEQKIEAKLHALKEFKESTNLAQLEKFKNDLKAKSDRLKVLNDGNDIIKLAVRLDKSSLNIKEKEFSNIYNSYLAAIEGKRTYNRTKLLHSLSKKTQSLNYEFSNSLNDYEELCSLRNQLFMVTKLSDLVLVPISFKSKLESYKELKSTKEHILNLKFKIKKLREEERQIQNRLIEIKSKLNEFKVCPLCHQEIKEGDRC